MDLRRQSRIPFQHPEEIQPCQWCANSICNNYYRTRDLQLDL